MGGAVFADTNRIVREDIDVRQSRQRGQPNGGPAIISEDKKRRAGCTEHSVIGNAVHNGAHAVFANAEANVTALRRLARKIARVLDVVQGRSMQMGAAA